jgi:hypothetical protein
MNPRIFKWLAAAVAIIGLAIVAGVYSPTLSGQSFSLVGSTASVAGCSLGTTVLVAGQPFNVRCGDAALELRTTTAVFTLSSAAVPCQATPGNGMLVARRKEGAAQIPVKIIASNGPDCL